MKTMTMKTMTIISLLAMLFLAACAQQTAKEPYKFGAVLPLSGTNAFYGEFSRYGLDLGVAKVNERGGVNGRQVEIIYEDSEGDKSRATTAAQKLVNVDGVDALFTTTTPMSGAIAPVAEEYRVPFIYASATPTFAMNKSFVFKDYVDAVLICQDLMKQIVKDGKKNVAIFGTKAEFTILCQQGAEKVGKIAAVETYTVGESDFRTQFSKLKESGVDAIVLAVFAPDCPNVFKPYRELGLDAQLYFPFQSFTCGSSDNTKANADLMADAYGTDIALDEESTDPEFVAFKTELVKRGWTTQIRGSALLYDSVLEMAKAMDGCGDSTCIANNLRGLNGFRGVTGTVNYHGGQVVEREIMLTKFDGSEWVKAR